jgi:hypothetical protein
MLPRLALGPHRPASVPSGMYQGAFAKKNRVRGLPPPPPRGHPVQGYVHSAERGRAAGGPRPPTNPPQVDTQGNASRQLAGAVVLGSGAAPAPPLAGSGRSCTSCSSSIRVPKKNARCPGRAWGAAPEGLAGMAELRPLFPGGGGGGGRGGQPGGCAGGVGGPGRRGRGGGGGGGGRRSKAAASSRVFFLVFKEIAARRTPSPLAKNMTTSCSGDCEPGPEGTVTGQGI